MIIRLRKRQLTYQQRKEIITALLYYGLAYIQAVVRHFQCSISTVWRIWSLYQNGGQIDDAILLKPRHSQHPSEHTRQEHDLIVTVLAENPKARYNKIYTLLRSLGYMRSYKGMWGYISIICATNNQNKNTKNRFGASLIFPSCSVSNGNLM